MKYFWFTNSIKIKEIGRFPQCIEHKKYVNLSDTGKRGEIKFLHALPELLMEQKAKPTTYISTPIGNTFLVVRNYFIDFLTSFKINNFTAWKIQVHYRKKILEDYSLFHLSYPRQAQYIDYTNSDFYIGKIGDRDYKGRSIKVKNCENYLNTYKILHQEGYWLKCNCLIFDFSCAAEDLIRLVDIPFGNGYYVSERLKDAIEQERFTGMEFKEIEEYNKKIKVIY